MSYGHNPAHKLWVQCVDVDRLASLMCYLQLSLWHVPAEVVIGNSLTMEVRQKLYTPAHYMGGWDMRLHCRQANELLTQSAPNEPEAEKPKHSPTEPSSVGKEDSLQFDFGF